jgi:hypothetical protein
LRSIRRTGSSDRSTDGPAGAIPSVIQPPAGGSVDEFSQAVDGILAAVRGRRDLAPAFPFPFHPRRPGLLPWGYIGLDWVLCWHTTGPDPDAWTTVITIAALDEGTVFEAGMSACLLDIVSGAARIPALRYVAEACAPPCFTPLTADVQPERRARRVGGLGRAARPARPGPAG